MKLLLFPNDHPFVTSYKLYSSVVCSGLFRRESKTRESVVL